MVAVYIDPAVCHTWAGWIIPECYGIALYVGAALAAFVSAYGVRRVARQ
jgi:hypothetical protein